MLQATCPLFVAPAKHITNPRDPKKIGKTERAFAEYAQHWTGHPNLQIVSYELISNRPELLDQLAPDAIICDEAHKLKHPRSACTRRIARYLRTQAQAGVAVSFCALSGTLMSRSLLDWWHLQLWALPSHLMPLPHSWPVVQSWAAALDEKLDMRRPIGALRQLVEGATSETNYHDVRKAFGTRLRGAPGVITADGDTVAASLQIEPVAMRVPVIDQAVAQMRRVWCTPDGVEFSEGSDLWRHARELANGFYYRWEPTPPVWWLDPRREYNAFLRDRLSGSRTLDTLGQVAKANVSHPLVQAWLAVKDKYEPTTVPVWLANDVLDRAAAWAHDTGGLVWVEHRAVGQRLEAYYKLPYFSEQGLDNRGRFIEDHSGPAVVSSLACIDGYNLQYKWSDNCVLNWTPQGAMREQLLGRTHREGQQADTVTCLLLMTVEEQHAGLAQAQRDALAIQESTKQAQKLCYADYV
jgi:hypothetical protein